LIQGAERTTSAAPSGAYPPASRPGCKGLFHNRPLFHLRSNRPHQPVAKSYCRQAGAKRWDARRANPEEWGVPTVRRNDACLRETHRQTGWSATQRFAFFNGL